MKIRFIQHGGRHLGCDHGHGRCEVTGQLRHEFLKIEQQIQGFWSAAGQWHLRSMVPLHDKVAARFQRMEHPRHVLFSNRRRGVEPRTSDELVHRLIEGTHHQIVDIVHHLDTVAACQPFAFPFSLLGEIKHLGMPPLPCSPHRIPSFPVRRKQRSSFGRKRAYLFNQPCVGFLAVCVGVFGKATVPAAGIRATVGIHSSSPPDLGGVIIPCSSMTSLAPGSTANKSSVGNPVTLYMVFAKRSFFVMPGRRMA